LSNQLAEKKINEILSKIPVDINVSKSRKDLEMLRAAIIAEYDAVNLYEQFADQTENIKIKNVLLDIAQEEKVHIGEFEALLRILDDEHAESEIEGKSEVENISGH